MPGTLSECHGCSRPLPPRSRFCPSCGVESAAAVSDDQATDYLPPAPTAPPADATHELVPGTVLAGRFRVVALLGRGGMGEVYRCQDLRLRETVALKLLPAHLAQDPDARRRLDDEVRVARRVTHPHVCRVFDVVDLETTVALCMEYIDGEDLSSLLRRVGHLAPQRALRVARQIVLGVVAIHRQGLVHRDLKPANVMLDGRGDARVSDLGLASAAGDGGFAGTPAYMAPEQLAGGAATVRSDLWSLALVLHELFSGEPAFPPARSVGELLAARATPPPRLDPEAAWPSRCFWRFTRWWTAARSSAACAPSCPRRYCATAPNRCSGTSGSRQRATSATIDFCFRFRSAEGSLRRPGSNGGRALRCR
jgi:serine/threonine protein kinase